MAINPATVTKNGFVSIDGVTIDDQVGITLAIDPATVTTTPSGISAGIVNDNVGTDCSVGIVPARNPARSKGKIFADGVVVDSRTGRTVASNPATQFG